MLADLIADGAPFPDPDWWAAHAIAPEDRFSAREWAARVGSSYTRIYAHGVTVALSWLLGEAMDARLMAPVFDGAGQRIAARDREDCQATLWLLSTCAGSAAKR